MRPEYQLLLGEEGAVIPRRFTLPGDYVVKVKWVTFDWLQAYAQSQTPDVRPDDKVYAFYDDQGGKGTIFLVKGRHPLLQALDFTHELKHAMAEWEDHFLGQAGLDAVVEEAITLEVKGAAD